MLVRRTPGMGISTGVIFDQCGNGQDIGTMGHGIQRRRLNVSEYPVDSSFNSDTKASLIGGSLIDAHVDRRCIYKWL